MPPTPSSLFSLPHAERVIRKCDVCDETKRMVARDTSTNWCACAGCVPFLLIAERAMILDLQSARQLRRKK